VIRKRHLDTYVEGYCASACTIAFLAGKERAAAPFAKIGFHASRSVGSQARAPSREETAQLRELYRGAGLPDTFIRQALDTPNQTMWFPSQELMLSARVLTRKSMGGETAALSTVTRSRDAFVADLMKVELFQVLAEHAPNDFDKLVSAAWEQIRHGATDAQVMIAAREQLSELVPRVLPLGSDQTLVAYQALMVEQLEALRDREPAACVEMAFPSGHPMSVVGNLPPELVQRETALMAQLIREADTARAPKPSHEDLARVVRQALRGMTQEELQVFANEGARRRIPPAQTCDVAVRYFAALNAIPLAERAHDLRILYGSD
jgi:putative lipoic acid-binding regulatory protein